MDVKENVKQRIQRKRFEYDRNKFILTFPAYVLPNCKDDNEKRCYYNIFKVIGIVFSVFSGTVCLTCLTSLVKGFDIESLIFVIISGLGLLGAIIWLISIEKGLKMTSEDSGLLADKFVEDSDNFTAKVENIADNITERIKR